MVNKSFLMTKISKKLFEIAKRNNIKKLERLALQYNRITPDFNIIKFDSMSGLGVHGNVRYTNEDTHRVKEDISVARSFAKFLKDEYGAQAEVNFSIKSNIFDLQIKVLNVPSHVNENDITRHLECLVIGNDY